MYTGLGSLETIGIALCVEACLLGGTFLVHPALKVSSLYMYALSSPAIYGQVIVYIHHNYYACLHNRFLLSNCHLQSVLNLWAHCHYMDTHTHTHTHAHTHTRTHTLSLAVVSPERKDLASAGGPALFSALRRLCIWLWLHGARPGLLCALPSLHHHRDICGARMFGKTSIFVVV